MPHRLRPGARRRAPLFFCHPARLSTHGRTSVRRWLLFCHPRPRSLRAISEEMTPPMHCPGGDPMSAQNAPPECGTCLFCQPDFTYANPGVSRIGSPACRAVLRGPAAGRGIPMPHPAWGSVQCEGAHRTRGLRRGGPPKSSSRARRIDRRGGEVRHRRTDGARRVMIPNIIPQICAQQQLRIRSSPNPFDEPSRKIPRRLDSY
ncbi:hypothetical protein HDC95_001129 [Microbacterium sp. AK031]|nr:hypothetical protein [Microbacterium sp. AK031]